MNALAHCVEALYRGRARGRQRGAAGIDRWLPRVLEDGRDLEARSGLLEAASDAGQALAERGLFLAHAMAQAVAWCVRLPHGR
jgi:alcohol dehydrogenase class IV